MRERESLSPPNYYSPSNSDSRSFMSEVEHEDEDGRIRTEG